MRRGSSGRTCKNFKFQNILFLLLLVFCGRMSKYFEILRLILSFFPALILTCASKVQKCNWTRCLLLTLPPSPQRQEMFIMLDDTPTNPHMGPDLRIVFLASVHPATGISSSAWMYRTSGRSFKGFGLNVLFISKQCQHDFYFSAQPAPVLCKTQNMSFNIFSVSMQHRCFFMHLEK